MLVGEAGFSAGSQAMEPGVPLPSPVVMSSAADRRLCVGMATHDDFDGVWFTVQVIGMTRRTCSRTSPSWWSTIIRKARPDGYAGAGRVAA